MLLLIRSKKSVILVELRFLKYGLKLFNPLPENQYNWYVELWEYYNELNFTQNGVASNAEHFYMASYLTDNIAQGLKEFDDNANPLDNYLGFAWEGLETFGVDGGYITQAQLNNYFGLTANVNNDNHINNCDN